MILALQFTTPALLIGAVAAAIPVALHLLASARAREVAFPTLRFVRRSMQRTARRRRVRNWLLLLLRSLLLGLLAFAVAEPYSQSAADTPTGTRPYAAVLIVDNSLSMAADADVTLPEGPTLFERAKTQAARLLGGSHPPVQAAVLTTNEPEPNAPRTAPQRLDRDREALPSRLAALAAPRGGADRLMVRLRRAIKLLRRAEPEQRAVYVFTDAQPGVGKALERVAAELAAAGIRLAVVRPGDGAPPNVAAADLSVMGAGVLGRPVRIEALVRNFAPVPARVTPELTVKGASVAKLKPIRLASAGTDGDRRRVGFDYVPDTVGAFEGRVHIRPEGAATRDAAALDNALPFRVDIRDRARVLVVYGPREGDASGYDPSKWLRTALSPFDDPSQAWSIAVRPADGIAASAFEPDQLGGMDAAFFVDVPAFSAAQAEAVAQFARRDGRVALFLGPQVDVDNYNRRLGATGVGLLPGVLRPAVGRVGDTSDGVLTRRPDATHPLLAGLYEEPSRYRPPAVMRYYPVDLRQGDAQVPLRHTRAAANDAGDPVLVTAPFGDGHVMLCTTTASSEWSNLAARPIFLPMVVRMATGETTQVLADNLYAVGASAVLPLPSDLPPDVRVSVMPPEAAQQTVTLRNDRAVFADTWHVGRYDWVAQAPRGGRVAGGALFVHMPLVESDFRPVDAAELKARLEAKGLQGVTVATELPAPGPAVSAAPPRRPWWDYVLAAVVALLVVEAVIANRRQRMPAHPGASPS
ncbi:MAG: BatA domain-containing protein [Phycisphaerae bacterium]|nr:BatA domain-containing protein [Phycisphaerae bacterium]